MGITIVQGSDLSKKKYNAKTALVLAGGAVSGGAYKAGGLKALNDFLVNKKVTDFDIYVGISAGGFLSVPLAGGIPPEEILKSLDGNSDHFEQLSPFHIYYPNWKEFVERPLKYLYDTFTYFPGIIIDFVSSFPQIETRLRSGLVRFFKDPSYSNYEKLLKPLVRSLYSSRGLPSVFSAMPSGAFDNRSFEKYLRRQVKMNRMSNNFKVLKRMRGKDLYISATELDTAERVIFGWDEINDISISEAVMASTALPGFYKPARVKGVDYIDGGVRQTASIDIAIQKGADLVICYNPFRPFKNIVNLEYLREGNRYVTADRRIAESGVFGVINQVFRTLYHSRLMYGIEKYQEDKNFKSDIILIEPKEDDFTFYDMNPFAFWNRARAAKHGFESVKQSIEERFEEISAILSSYGIEMTREFVKRDEEKMKKAANDEDAIMNVLEGQSPRRRLRVISG
ncbi:MAG: patatin-like phospholipase family protein, partial [Deltaproteobacteria bacterium]|nr:patatin-like phospholipase family protein [Deltaproteobacteria bacterium]